MKNLADYILTKENHLPDTIIDKVTRCFHSNNDLIRRYRKPDFRVSNDLTLPLNGECSALLAPYTVDIFSQYTSLFPWCLSDFEFSNNQFFDDGYLVVQYPKEEGFFNIHIDQKFDPNSNPRLFAIIWYLNDVEEGGETFFPVADVKISPRKGTGMVFPCNWLFPHSSELAVSNDKYIVTTFIHAKPYDFANHVDLYANKK